MDNSKFRSAIRGRSGALPRARRELDDFRESTDGTSRLWDVEDHHGRTVLPTTSSRGQFAFSSDGRNLTFIGTNFVVSTWDLSAGTHRIDRVLKVPGAIDGPILNGDGTIAVIMRNDGFIEVWDLDRFRLRDTIEPIPGGLEHLGQFDPRGRIINLLTKNGCLFLDLSTHKIIDKQAGWFLFFSPEGGGFVATSGGVMKLNLDRGQAEVMPEFMNTEHGSFWRMGLSWLCPTASRLFKLWSWRPLKLMAD